MISKSAAVRSLIGVALTASLMIGATVGVSANTVGNTEGCTPGYWKQSQHFDSWNATDYRPTTLVGAVFQNAGVYANTTFLEALSLKGGSTLDGAKAILLRAAVAAELNADHDALDYPFRRNDTGFNGEPPIEPTVSQLLLNGTREQILAFASRLDAANNLGCPLN